MRSLATCRVAIVLPAILSAAAAQAQTVADAQPTPGTAADAGAAESAAAAQTGDIIVTATRTSEALSRVPISISAYDQARLDAQSVRRVDDIARLTPGIVFNRGAGVNGNNTSISIRGIASGIGAATTGIYIDDTPIQSRNLGNTATNAYPLVFDLQRVEILRGPQGTLFGASAQGGTVRFITPKPSLTEFSGYARAELAMIDDGGTTYEGGVAAGGPIVQDKLGFRASAWYRRDGGWVDRIPPLRAGATSYPVTDKNINTSDVRAFKFALAWSPVEALTITPSVYHQDQRADDAPVFFGRVTTGGTPLAPANVLRLSDPSRQKYVNAFTIPQTSKDRFTLPALLVELELGAATLISNTSYFDRKLTSVGDYTYLVGQLYGSRTPFTTLPNEASPSNFVNSQKVFSQEVRLQSSGEGRLRWVIGAFYARARQEQLQDIVTKDLNQQILNRTNGASTIFSVYRSNLLPGDLFFLTDIDSVDKQLAGFAQVDWEIVDRLTLTAGLRLSETKFDTDVYRDGPLAGGRNITVGRQKQTPLTPKFGISYQHSPETLIYASAAEGFRPGGAQAQLSPVACAPDFQVLGISETPPVFNSDRLWSYEVGTKNRLGSAVSLDASAFLVKWRGIQQNVFLRSCSGSFTSNTGEVTSRGFDMTVQVRPFEGFSIGAALGYTKASFDETVFSVEPNILRTKGSRLSVPPFTITVSGQYDFDITASTRGYARFDYQHAGRGIQALPTDFGFDPLNDVRAEVNILNVRAGAKVAGLDVSVFADNVTNWNGVALGHLSATAGLFTGVAPRPRVIGVTAAYRY